MATFTPELDSSMTACEAPVRRHTSLPLPKQFDGTSELWPRWRARFQRFRLRSGLSEKPDSKQVGTLLYSMGQQHSLLSGSACSRLGLVARLHSLTPEKPDFRKELPNLFGGLGKLNDSYTIKLRPNVQLFSIFTPRKIAHPLLDKVKAEIKRMLDDDVITPVEEPTEWCSGIVVVPKATPQYGSAWTSRLSTRQY
ncbi:Pol polyprotein [Elysia marginata]|uniref:Pol polyprotein n=1 Tax=Elysia marginata TaxID=1093978 RepID=A0AAV4IBM3_9GAST|nr:Pol polyprotein [Elysia marginata]